MYWPTSAARALRTPSALKNDPIIAIRPSRRGNFFASLSKSALGVWDVRPSVLQAAVVRTTESLERWGDNVDVFWASDGRGVIILTSTSHLLVYQLVPTSGTVYDYPAASNFPLSVGAGEGDALMGWELRPLGAAFVMGGATTILAHPHTLMLGLRHPPSLLTVSWPLPTACLSPPGSHFPPSPLDAGGLGQEDFDQWDLSNGRDWLESQDEEGIVPIALSVTRTQGIPSIQTMITQDGRVYAMYNSHQVANLMPSPTASTPQSRPSPSPLPPHQASASNYFTPVRKSRYTAHLLHPLGTTTDNGDSSSSSQNGDLSGALDESEIATEAAVNPRFGSIAIGTKGGTIKVISVPPYPRLPKVSHVLDLKSSANIRVSPGRVTSLAWTTDGYSLAVGYEHGWAVWSVSGRLNGWGIAGASEGEASAEGFMNSIKCLFWVPGNLELFTLSALAPNLEPDQIYIIPFVKSATTSQHSPDNTRYAFMQIDDRVMVYRGADQPDMSVINPESDIWQNIKMPDLYMSINWPIRYASISSDGKLIAIAGRRGLTHYSVPSGRWKLFEDERQERDFVVRGGLLWYRHVLVAAIDVGKTHLIRLYSRDTDLADQHILHSQQLPAPILVMSLLDNSLLAYTADNTLYHFLILPVSQTYRLHLCGSISFAGIVAVPSRVRALSWLIPQAQKDLGDPADDLIVATIIFLVDGQLVLLRPRKAEHDEVRYDMQVLADRIESYWTHLHGLGTLENSLWGWDGLGMRIWLDALTIEATKVDESKDAYVSVKESIHLPLDFYPLSILMDKGIIIGVDFETSTRSLPFTLFKLQTATQLFLPPFMRHHLSRRNLNSALIFAVNYASIIYFAHSLEVLLHNVLEDEVDNGLDLLPLVIEFLDHFPESLDVVVACARKTEVERWGMLFDVVGKPRGLFEKCLEDGMLKTAAGYLLVLQNLEELEDVKDTVRVLRLAIAAKEFQLCKEVLRFLQSVDDTGNALRTAIADVGLLPDLAANTDASTDAPNAPMPAHKIEQTSNNGTLQSSADTTVRPALPQHLSSTGSALSSSSKTSDLSRLTPDLPTPSSSATPTSPYYQPRLEHLRSDSDGPISSPFQLSSPRSWMSPPSPRTVDGVDQVPDQPTVSTPPYDGTEAPK